MRTEIAILGPGAEATLATVAPDVFDHHLQSELSAEFLADPRHHLAVAGLRLSQATFLMLFIIGAVSKRPSFHGFLAALMVAMMVFTAASLFVQPAPLTS